MVRKVFPGVTTDSDVTTGSSQNTDFSLWRRQDIVLLRKDHEIVIDLDLAYALRCKSSMVECEDWLCADDSPRSLSALLQPQKKTCTLLDDDPMTPEEMDKMSAERIPVPTSDSDEDAIEVPNDISSMLHELRL